jgi:hypothetical protein
MLSPFRSPPGAPPHPFFIAVLLVLGVFVFAGAWLAVATACDSRVGWMALLATLNSIALLRLARTHSGKLRAMLAVLVTGVSIALGEWLLAALPIAWQMDQSPLEAARRMGPEFSWMLVQLANTPLDWGLMVAALLLAAWFGR